jgi:hypothetical protein
MRSVQHVATQSPSLTFLIFRSKGHEVAISALHGLFTMAEKEWEMG